MFEDYYYGDDIFTKPKNGAKKEKQVKKVKQIKNKKKVKCEKLKKQTSSFSGAENLPKKNGDYTSDAQSNKIKINCEYGSKEGQDSDNGFFINIAQLANELANKEHSFDNNIQKQTIMPIKPIPQRHNGSKINLLLNACKISDGGNGQVPGMDGSKKRDDKALNKSIQDILSNDPAKLLLNESNFQQLNEKLIPMKSNGSLANMTDTITALLNLQNRCKNRSGSENEDSSKLITPSNKKTKRVFADGYASSDKKPKRISYSDNKGSYSLYKGTEKRDLKHSFIDEDYSVTRVKQTVQNGGITQLILERKQDEIFDPIINISNPSKSLLSSFSGSLGTPNLNSLITKLGKASEEGASIAKQVRDIMANSLSKKAIDLNRKGSDLFSYETKINSLPILYVNNLK